MSELKNQPTKEELLTLMREWINQRPGLDPANYGFPAYDRESWLKARRSYNQESRKITNQRKDALTLLRAVELSSGLTAGDILTAFRAFSGRLQVFESDKGFYLDYCTGQDFPTEYRAAACAVLAAALWDYHRSDYENEDHAGDKIRAMFKRMFGRGIQSRWLD